ncbi:MAG: hypothetical protein AAGA05_06765 [Pseudomonadota bacterium]
MKKLLLILASLIVFPMAASAQGVTYECELSNNESYGWISPKMIVSVDPDKNAAAVLDAYIYRQHEHPIPVEFRQTRNGLYKLKWSLSAVPAAARTIKASWSATLDPKSQVIRAHAILNGYDNRPSGQGRCKVVKSKTLLQG